MNKKERNILEQVKNHHEGLLSPAQMINSIAHRNTKAVENLIIFGYLEKVPEYKPRVGGQEKYLFYRITEKGLRFFDPLYKKVWFLIKTDLRTIVISAITAVVTTALIKLIFK